jgi:hypothetical protein
VSRFPHELLVLGVPAQDRERTVREVIERVGALTDITVVDALLVVMSSGEVAEMIEIIGTACDPGLMSATPGLISDEDVVEIGSVLAPDGTAVALLVKHVWVSRLAQDFETLSAHWLASVLVPTDRVRAAEKAASRRRLHQSMRWDSEHGEVAS